MLIVKQIATGGEGTWITLSLWGEDVEVQVRPLTPEIVRGIRARHVTGHEYVQNSLTGRRERLETINVEKVGDDMVDYIIQDFRNLGDAPDKPWPCDLEHKQRLSNLPVPAGERPVYERLVEAGKGLAFEVARDTEERSKN